MTGLTKWSRGFSASPRVAETEEWFVFPRETEANNYDINWSLVNDGITPSDNAYHNARLPVLATYIPQKAKNNAFELSSPVYSGEFKVVEAGDSISHDAFSTLHNTANQHLSGVPDLFVEDGVLGSSLSPMGFRLVTTNPALALIARSLLVSCRFEWVLQIIPLIDDRRLLVAQSCSCH